jgi:hypothetical protein
MAENKMFETLKTSDRGVYEALCDALDEATADLVAAHEGGCNEHSKRQFAQALVIAAARLEGADLVLDSISQGIEDEEDEEEGIPFAEDSKEGAD